jgi:hypothetical protein
VSGFYNRIKNAISTKKPIQFEPTAAKDDLARYGFRQLMMNEQLEQRVALITELQSLIADVFSSKTSQIDKLKVIDEALPKIIIIGQAWGRGKQVWMDFSAQFRELRSMPAFTDTLVEEFMDMINHGWLPQDIVTPIPIIMQVLAAGRAPYDMGEFDVKTRKTETTKNEYAEE